MAAATIQILVDLSGFASDVSDIFSQRVAAGVTNLARKKVRKDTYNLTNQIRTVPVGKGHYNSEVDESYAPAQEFGRPDLKKYGFDPYMRPAADEISSNVGLLNQYYAEAEEAAINRRRR